MHHAAVRPSSEDHEVGSRALGDDRRNGRIGNGNCRYDGESPSRLPALDARHRTLRVVAVERSVEVHDNRVAL
jgi:hypothetical protein